MVILTVLSGNPSLILSLFHSSGSYGIYWHSVTVVRLIGSSQVYRPSVSLEVLGDSPVYRLIVTTLTKRNLELSSSVTTARARLSSKSLGLTPSASVTGSIGKPNAHLIGNLTTL
jgi:hypothetical protein